MRHGTTARSSSPAASTRRPFSAPPPSSLAVPLSRRGSRAATQQGAPGKEEAARRRRAKEKEKNCARSGAGRRAAADSASRRAASESGPASSRPASTLASTTRGRRKKKSPDEIVEAWTAGASLLEEAEQEKKREARARQEKEAAKAAHGGEDGLVDEDYAERGSKGPHAETKASFEAYSRENDEARFSILDDIESFWTERRSRISLLPPSLSLFAPDASSRPSKHHPKHQSIPPPPKNAAISTSPHRNKSGHTSTSSTGCRRCSVPAFCRCSRCIRSRGEAADQRIQALQPLYLPKDVSSSRGHTNRKSKACQASSPSALRRDKELVGIAATLSLDADSLTVQVQELQGHLEVSQRREAASRRLIAALKEENEQLIGALGHAAAKEIPPASWYGPGKIPISSIRATRPVWEGGSSSLALYVG